MNRAWLAPIAFFYNIAVSVRHKMFDLRILRSQQCDIPVICVGNLTVGGTGKTPFTEMLIRNLKKDWTIAVLSRGYKRRTKGYLEVGMKTSFLSSGDEARQIKIKFPDVVVAVCEKRVEGIASIREHHPEVNLIILDDAFQHRYVEPWVNIVLMDYTRPVYQDHLLPWGNLRDKLSQMHRAGYVVVTKCPPGISPLDKRLVRKSLKLYPYQKLYFTSTHVCQPSPMFGDAAHLSVMSGDNVIAMSGIGNNRSFVDSLEQQFNVVGTLQYPDHHPYHSRDLKDMRRALDDSPQGTVIITTEKDAVKLMNSKKIPKEIRERLFFIPIKISFNDDLQYDFLTKLNNDLRTNPKDCVLHTD